MSSIGASAMPWRARSLTAALTFWPIFRIAGSSSTGLRSASASRERHLAVGRLVEEAAGPVTWASGR